MVYKMNIRIGPFLREIRESKGSKGFWSVRAVAKRADISNSYLSQLETGKVEQPLPDILKKLAEALRHPYEDLLRAAGYLPPEKEKPKTIEIPIRGTCPADKFNFAFEEIYDTVVLNYDFVKDKNCFALRVKGDCLKDAGIFDKDIVIVSPHAQVNNGDIIIARVGEECTMKKFYKTDDQIILQPCNANYAPIILKPKEKDIEIIGKVIHALKSF